MWNWDLNFLVSGSYSNIGAVDLALKGQMSKLGPNAIPVRWHQIKFLGVLFEIY